MLRRRSSSSRARIGSGLKDWQTRRPPFDSTACRPVSERTATVLAIAGEEGDEERTAHEIHEITRTKDRRLQLRAVWVLFSCHFVFFVVLNLSFLRFQCALAVADVA